MKDTLNNRNAVAVWHFLKNNPEAGYAEIAQVIDVPEDKANYVNTLLKKLQRGGYIEIERVRSTNGKISPSYKRVLMEPKIT